MNEDTCLPRRFALFSCGPFSCPPAARRIFRRIFVSAVLLAILPAAATRLSADDSAPASPVVLATVDGMAITEHQLQLELDRAVSGRDLPPAALGPLREAALKQLIDRRLVAIYLQENDFGARPQEVDRQLQRVRERLEQQQLTLDQHLQRAGLSVDEFRDGLAWQIAWSRFLERYLTDENLERYFQKHRRDFDGTQVSAAHILLRIDSPEDPQSRDAALAAAQQLRTWIQDGELSFARAAQRYSVAPTAAAAGELGFIGRRQPMPEAFAQAAFALEPGDISPPVVTTSGVHLIQCLEIKPGTQSWQDVRTSLEEFITQHLFRWAADRQRPRAKIEIR